MSHFTSISCYHQKVKSGLENSRNEAGRRFLWWRLGRVKKKDKGGQLGLRATLWRVFGRESWVVQISKRILMDVLVLKAQVPRPQEDQVGERVKKSESSHQRQIKHLDWISNGKNNMSMAEAKWILGILWCPRKCNINFSMIHKLIV